MKKLIILTTLILISCNSKNWSTQTTNENLTDNDNLSQEEAEKNFIKYHNKIDSYLQAGASFTSYSKTLALIIEKNIEGYYDINKYENINNNWEKTEEKVATYTEPLVIKKAKNSNRFLVIRTNGSSIIELYDIENSYMESFEVEEVFPNQVSISEDGKRIFYRNTSDLNKLYIIDEVSDKVWENTEFGNNIELKEIFKTKYSKNYVLVHYWDNSFTPYYHLFKIETDYSLTKVLDLTDELSSLSLNYLEDVTLTDSVFSYRLTDVSGILISTYVKDIYTGVWFKTEDIEAVFSAENKRLNSIFSDSFRDNLIINYYDINNKSLVSSFYFFNYDLNEWVLEQKNVLENIIISGEFSFWDRVTFEVNKNALDIMVEVQDFGKGFHEFRGLSFQIIKEQNNNNLTVLDTFNTHLYSLDVNYTSLSGGRALIIDKENGTYYLNLYKSVNGSWLKQKTIYSNTSFFTLRKAKNSDTFITYFQTSNNNIINIFEPSLDLVSSIEVGKIYTSLSNKPLISSDGSRIVFCTYGEAQNLLKLINKDEDGTFSINELTGLNLKIALNVKFSGNYIVARYKDLNSDLQFDLFKINEDYSLNKDLTIKDEDFANKNRNFDRDMVLSNTMFAYISNVTDFSSSVTIFKNNGNSWTKTGTVEIEGWYYFNRYLDYFSDSFVFHGFNISADSHHKIKTVLFNFENGEWLESNSNVFIIDGGFTSPLAPDRLSYNLNDEALDACILIKSEKIEGVWNFKNKCFSNRSFAR